MPTCGAENLEGVLNRLFEERGILIREAFRLRGPTSEGVIEQIDGVIEFDARIFLVEMKWWNIPLGVNEIAPHLVRIVGRSGANGLIISDSGFTGPAIAQCREYLLQKTIVLCSLQEIVELLYREDRNTCSIAQESRCSDCRTKSILECGRGAF